MLFVDYETRSKVNLPAVGSHVYANDPSTEILMVGCATEDDTPRISETIGGRQFHLVSWGRFDYQIYRALENPDYPSDTWIDAQAIARYTGMPGGLDAFSKALGFGIHKDTRGKRLITKYCKPPGGGGPFLKLEGEDLTAMEEYCLQDVVLLQEAWKRLKVLLPEWEMYCRPAYEATEAMNELGVPIDRVAAGRALDQCRAHEARLVEECANLCGFRPSQNLRIAEFLGMGSCSKGDLEKRTFKDPTQQRVRDIRLEFAKAATKKLVPMLEMSAVTGRAHGCFVFNGAHTGRGSSQDIQFQNMVRAEVNPEVFRKLHAGETLHLPLQDVQENIRGFIQPMKGGKLISVDYSQLEARIAAWLSDCTELLDGFKDTTRDVYREAAARAYGIPLADVGPAERSYGKIAILGPTYGAGGKALAAQAPGYGIEMTEAEGDKLKTFYRTTFPEIPLLWDKLEDAAMQVVSHRTEGAVWVGPIGFTLNASGKTLELILPSGRKMRFLYPAIGEDRFGDAAVVVLTKHGKRSIWGGHWLENICQAIAADLKNDALVRISDLGYDPILEVHDEIVVEEYARWEVVLEDMVFIMETPPSWAPKGLFRAEGKIMGRYSK